MARNDESGFSMRLSNLLTESGLTVKEAASICGTGTSQIQSWKSGTLSTDYAALSKLAEHLGITLEYLLTGENKTQPGIKEIFQNGELLFDGFLKVRIERMIPRKTKGNENE